MKQKIFTTAMVMVLMLWGIVGTASGADNPNPPSSPVKLIFIHHSTGGHWLADPNDDQPYGGLGIALKNNNYYVSATNYEWGYEGIGSRTDIPNWPEWFTGGNSSTIMNTVYNETGQNFYTSGDWNFFGSWSRLSTDPGGENQIIMFKSCFPNSNLSGNPNDPPLSAPDEQYGVDNNTVSNAKAVYNNILTYFQTRQDKLFVVITAPPLMESDTDAARAANARAFNNWLLNDWLDGYAYKNVAVFDYYNVLTYPDNHHRWYNGAVQHVVSTNSNFAYYPSGDSHPSSAGHQKAATEFVPLLNVFYHRWKDGGVATTTTTVSGTTSTTVKPSTTTTTAAVTTTTSSASTTTTTSAVSTTTTTNTGSTTTTTLPSSSSGRRLHPKDLVYKGAFAFPEGDGWGYGGHALAYYPAGDAGGTDGYPGSLYTSGLAPDMLAGEISIPEPVTALTFESLPRAAVLRNLADITGGRKDNCTCTYCEECIYAHLDGLEYLPNINKIVWNLRDWYNVSACDQNSLGWSNPDMSNPQGVWHIGSRNPLSGDERYNEFHNARTCDYLFKAPQDFADNYLGGKRLIAGNHRESGALGGSQGPTLFAVAPWKDGNPPSDGQNLDATALMYYRERFGCSWSFELDEVIPKPAADACDFPDYRAFDYWGGGAWVQTGEIRAILIFGRKAMGENCYGTQEECGGDPCGTGKGYHGYPYQAQVLLYDPEDLKAVIAGSKKPWEVLPYDSYSLADRVMGGECARLVAAAYDEERGIIYVTEQETEEKPLIYAPVVHVWQVVPFSAADFDGDGIVEMKDVILALRAENLKSAISALRVLVGF